MTRTRWEILFLFFTLAIQTLFLRDLLFNGGATLAHDNFFWNYPLFHFFAESLLQGQLPLWNPYSHGGEPFYPLLAQMRLLDPIPLITIFLGKWFTTDLTLLFNWHKYLMTVFSSLGVYLCFRRFSERLSIRFILWLVALLSSLFLAGFRADGALHSFLWIPWLTFFLLELMADESKLPSSAIWLGLGACLGINFQSYFFAVPLLWTLVFFTAAAIFDPTTLKIGLKKGSVSVKAVVLLGLFLMSLPNLVLYKDQDRFHFPARSVPSELSERGGAVLLETSETSPSQSIQMSWQTVLSTGSFGNFWNLIQLWAPEGHPALHSKESSQKTFGLPSEVYLYLGILPLCFAIFGICSSRSRTDGIFICLLISSLILYLGANTPAYRWFFEVLPPLKFLRHSEVFGLPLTFSLLYFSVRGTSAPLKFSSLWVTVLTGSLWIGTTAFFHPSPFFFLLKVVCLLAPILLFLQWRRPQLIGLALLFVVIDLGWQFQELDVLYRGTPNPHRLFGVDRNPKTYRLSKFRVTSAPFPQIIMKNHQAMRYAELVWRMPTVFSVLHEAGPGNDFESHLRGTRWNSYLSLASYSQVRDLYSPEALGELFAVTGPMLRWIAQSRDFFDSAFEEPGFQVQEATFNSLDLTISESGAGTFFWSQGFDPAWQAEVNGEPRFLEKSHAHFISLPLLEGPKVIRLRYRPWTWLIAVGLFQLAFWGLSGGAAFRWLTFNHQTSQPQDGYQTSPHKEWWRTLLKEQASDHRS